MLKEEVLEKVSIFNKYISVVSFSELSGQPYFWNDIFLYLYGNRLYGQCI